MSGLSYLVVDMLFWYFPSCYLQFGFSLLPLLALALHSGSSTLTRQLIDHCFRGPHPFQVAI